MKKQEIDKLFCGDHLTDEAYALYANAMLQNQEEQLPVLVREHVEHCFQCKKEVFAIYEICISTPILTKPEKVKTIPEPNVKKIKTGRILKFAASFLLLVSLGALIYYRILNKQIVQQKSLTDKKLDIVTLHNPIAENRSTTIDTSTLMRNNEVEYIGEVKIFEGLISSQYRNTDIETLSPKLNQAFEVNKPIIFKFSDDLSEPCRIIIFNNKGKKIMETEKFSSSSYIIHKKLWPGLYYWKLEKEEDLINVSRFIVTE